MGLLFGGSEVEKKIVKTSHWLNDTCVDVLWFAISFPIKLLIWAGDVVGYLVF